MGYHSRLHHEKAVIGKHIMCRIVFVLFLNKGAYMWNMLHRGIHHRNLSKVYIRESHWLPRTDIVQHVKKSLDCNFFYWKKIVWQTGWCKRIKLDAYPLASCCHRFVLYKKKQTSRSCRSTGKKKWDSIRLSVLFKKTEANRCMNRPLEKIFF